MLFRSLGKKARDHAIARARQRNSVVMGPIVNQGRVLHTRSVEFDEICAEVPHLTRDLLSHKSFKTELSARSIDLDTLANPIPSPVSVKPLPDQPSVDVPTPIGNAIINWDMDESYDQRSKASVERVRKLLHPDQIRRSQSEAKAEAVRKERDRDRQYQHDETLLRDEEVGPKVVSVGVQADAGEEPVYEPMHQPDDPLGQLHYLGENDELLPVGNAAQADHPEPDAEPVHPDNAEAASSDGGQDEYADGGQDEYADGEAQEADEAGFGMVYVTTPFRHLFNRRRKVVETVKPDPLTDLENAIVTTLPTMVFGIVASHFRDVVNTGSINGWTILIVNVGCVTVATYPQMAVGYAAFSIVTKLLQKCAFALPKGRGVGSFCIVGLYVQRVGLNPTPYDIQILLLTTVLS